MLGEYIYIELEIVVEGIDWGKIYRLVFYHLLVAGVLGNACMYMADLLAISDKRPVGLTSWPDIPNWSNIVTPMVVGEWDRLLASHPDQSCRRYLVDGLQYGFRIGFSHGVADCRSAVSNMSSASERPSVIDEFVDTELILHCT